MTEALFTATPDEEFARLAGDQAAPSAAAQPVAQVRADSDIANKLLRR